MPCKRVARSLWCVTATGQSKISWFDPRDSLEILKEAPAKSFGVLLSFVLLSPIFATRCPAKDITTLTADSPVTFDLPSVMTVTPVATNSSQVIVKLRLSALTNPVGNAQTQHWWIIACPEQPTMQVVDYSPRTETDCELSSGIDTKSSTEKSTSLGLGISFDYNHLANLRGAGDKATKELETLQFQTKAKRQAKIASGTINRGKGVYFKWMRTAEQVLDGEKEFQFTLQTPDRWRCGTICLTVIASGSDKQFNFQSASWQQNTKELQSQEFVIAIHREDDPKAAQAAVELTELEQKLRRLASAKEHPSDQLPWIKRLGDFGKKIEQVIKDTPNQSWLDQVMHGSIDPHHDNDIQKLPVETRVAILEYLEERRHFLALNQERISIAEKKTVHAPSEVNFSRLSELQMDASILIRD